MLTLLTTTLISALWPVLGPLATFAAREGTYLPDLLALRGGGPWHFDLTAMEGIVEMPSYHTILAVLFTYAFRIQPLLGIAALNGLMLLSIRDRRPLPRRYDCRRRDRGALHSWHPLVAFMGRKAHDAFAWRIRVNALKPRRAAPIAGLPAALSPADPSSHRYAAASASAAGAPRRAAPW